MHECMKLGVLMQAPTGLGAGGADLSSTYCFSLDNAKAGGLRPHLGAQAVPLILATGIVSVAASRKHALGFITKVSYTRLSQIYSCVFPLDSSHCYLMGRL